MTVFLFMALLGQLDTKHLGLGLFLSQFHPDFKTGFLGAGLFAAFSLVGLYFHF